MGYPPFFSVSSLIVQLDCQADLAQREEHRTRNFRVLCSSPSQALNLLCP